MVVLIGKLNRKTSNLVTNKNERCSKEVVISVESFNVLFLSCSTHWTHMSHICHIALHVAHFNFMSNIALHITHCMSHIYIAYYALHVTTHCIPSIVFVLFRECYDLSGQVNPVSIASAENMTEFGTALVCL